MNPLNWKREHQVALGIAAVIGAGAGDSDRLPSIKDAKKSSEIIDTGREHQGNAITGRNVTRNQAARKGARSGCKFSICQATKNRRLVLQHGQVQTVRMLRCMPLENLDQGPRFARSRHRWEGRTRRRLQNCPPQRRSSLFQRPHEIMDGLRLANGLSTRKHSVGVLDYPYAVKKKKKVA
jgi:hypothetical protein